jgi:translation initiation factor 2 subunit 1
METKINYESRFYKNKYPATDELVMVTVSEISEIGATVKLLEYNNIEALITAKEASKMQGNYPVSKALKKGKQDVCLVLRVDEEKGYIDLSKKKVLNKDLKMAEERYEKSKSLYTIMRSLSEKFKVDVEFWYKSLVWPISDIYPKEHPLDVFKRAYDNFDTVFEKVQIEPKYREKIHEEIKTRLKPQEIKVRTIFELTFSGYDGIERLKKALRAGEAVSNPEMQVKFYLKAPPYFEGVTIAYDEAKAVALLNEALEKVKGSISEAPSGKFEITEKPGAIGGKGNQNLADVLNVMEEEKDDFESEEEDNDAGIDLGD